MTNLAEFVRSTRVEHGLSQKEFAEKIGASQTAVSYWESGKRQIGIDQIWKIAEAFNSFSPYALSFFVPASKSFFKLCKGFCVFACPNGENKPVPILFLLWDRYWDWQKIDPLPQILRRRNS